MLLDILAWSIVGFTGLLMIAGLIVWLWDEWISEWNREEAITAIVGCVFIVSLMWAVFHLANRLGGG